MLILTLALCLGAPAATPPAKPALALFPAVLRGEPDAHLIDRLQELFVEEARQGGVTLLFGQELQTRLKKNSRKALAQCGDHLGCIAKLGRAVHAKHVIMTRVAKQGDTTKIALVVIDVASSKVARGTAIDLVSGQDPEAPLRTAARAALDVKPGAEPVEAVAAAAPSEEAAPAEPPPAAALPPALAVMLAPEESSSHRHGPILLYAAVGLTAAGVGVMAGGGYYAQRSTSLYNSIKRDGSISQVDAIERNNQANDQAKRANLFFEVGGGLLLTAGLTYLISALSTSIADAP